jgi:TetR/AcrR family transcriptional regulator, regulator of mycofactocin system
LALSAKIKRTLLLASPPVSVRQQALGRPPVTNHAAIEAAAFHLFATKGFDETTSDEIAEAAGIGRRTLFRYFPSKNDIPWGQFDDSLEFFRDTLWGMPSDLPVWQAVQRSVIVFNQFDASAIEQHRTRMRLILRTPSLQAHSVLMYERWRGVIAEYAATRLGQSSTALLPRCIGYVSLSLALSAYETWLDDEHRALDELLGEAMTGLRSYLQQEPPAFS